MTFHESAAALPSAGTCWMSATPGALGSRASPNVVDPLATVAGVMGDTTPVPATRENWLMVLLAELGTYSA